MKNEITEAYTELKAELAEINEQDASPANRFNKKTLLIENAITYLKKYVKSEPFNDPQQEISFFKIEKPFFIAELFYARELFNLEVRETMKIGEVTQDYLQQQELGYISHYFIRHQFLYQYYRSEGIELDHLLFTRQADSSVLLLPGIPGLDPGFSTKGDYFFSKFIAYERMRENLHAALYPAENTVPAKAALNWTGDKMHLIEIAYAIYDTAQINNGSADIKDIVGWLEDSLHISLTRHYRMFSEMKNRKSVSPTRYLDHAAEMLKEHLQRGEAFQPQAPKPVSGSRSNSNK